MNNRIRSLLAIALVLTLIAAACGNDDTTTATTDNDSSSPSTNEDAGSTAPEDASEADPEPAAPDDAPSPAIVCDTTTSPADMPTFAVSTADEPYKVALLLVTNSGYYFQALQYGAEQAAEAAGIELEVVAGEGFASAAVQIEQIEDVLARGVDAILLQPADTDGSVRVVELANEQGIPVVNVATEVASDDVFKVVQDDYTFGQTLADQVAVAVGADGGSGIFMAGPATATWSSKRVQGFTDRVAEAYPTIDVVATPETNVDPGEGLTAFENAYQANPDISWISGVYEFILPASSLSDDVVDSVSYVAASFEPSVVDGLESGTLVAAISTAPIVVGTVGVSTVVDVLNGDTVPAVNCIDAFVYGPQDVGSPVALAELIPEG